MAGSVKRNRKKNIPSIRSFILMTLDNFEITFYRAWLNSGENKRLAFPVLAFHRLPSTLSLREKITALCSLGRFPSILEKINFIWVYEKRGEWEGEEDWVDKVCMKEGWKIEIKSESTKFPFSSFPRFLGWGETFGDGGGRKEEAGESRWLLQMKSYYDHVTYVLPTECYTIGDSWGEIPGLLLLLPNHPPLHKI